MEYSVWNRLSRGISALMHPFVIPTWAVLLMLYGPTVMVNMPPRVKFFLLGIVAPLLGYANLYLCMAVVGVLALALFLVVAKTEKGAR